MYCNENTSAFSWRNQAGSTLPQINSGRLCIFYHECICIPNMLLLDASLFFWVGLSFGWMCVCPSCCGCVDDLHILFGCFWIGEYDWCMHCLMKWNDFIDCATTYNIAICRQKQNKKKQTYNQKPYVQYNTQHNGYIVLHHEIGNIHIKEEKTNKNKKQTNVFQGHHI